VLTLLAAPCQLQAVPVEIARESFEGTAGAIGFSTSAPQFDEPSVATSDFFSVVNNNGTVTSGGAITGGDGTKMFAAEDIDTAPALLAPQQTITFNPVNIAGRTTVTARLLLAAPGTGPAAGGSQNFYDHDVNGVATDFLRVEASVDGGPFTRLAQFSPATATLNQPLSLDLDGNGVGGEGPALTAAFQEFSYPVSNGATVQVRVILQSNATSEYLCVDNVRIFADTPATAAPSLGGVPGTALTYIEGSPAAPLAPAMTVTDPDSTNLTQAVITVSSGYVNGQDILSAAPGGAILAGDIVFNAAAGTLTITRTATKAHYETVLRTVSYRNSDTTAPVTAPRQVQFRISDGTNFSNQPIRQVEVVDAISTRPVPFTESFETNGHGTRYALDGRFASGTAFFERRTISGLTNVDGAFVVGGEDTVLNPAGVEAVRFAVNTAGLSLPACSLRVAAPGGAVYDAGDLVALETSADGGPWTPAAEFRSTAGAAGNMALDTNGDGTGDGAPLTAVMQRFDFILPAAATLGLRVRLVSNTAGELLAVDRISVTSGGADGPFIPVAGTLAHSENFNTLPAADTPWADSTLRRGWFAQINNGTMPAGLFQASDGTTALTGLINCGASGSADRAPGSKATSTGGFANVAYAAVFKNISDLPVQLTRLRYAQELWRSGTATAEKVTAFYAISSAPLASIQSGTSSATAAGGAGFTAFPAGANTSVSPPSPDLALDGNAAANRSAVDFPLPAGTGPVIQPGQYLTLKWTDTNEAGNDGHQAIDDVVVDFLQLDCGINATLTSVIRTPGANPADPADDTVDFIVSIAGVGSVSPSGFVIMSPPFAGTTGAYGSNLQFPGAPLALFAPSYSLTLADQGNAACQTTVTVPLPSVLGLASVGGSPRYIQATGAPAMFRQTGGTEMTADPGTGVLLTDAFPLTAGSEKCVTLTIEAQDLSTGSGFEATDNFKVELLTNSAQAPVQPLGLEFDLNRDGVLSGGGTPETDELNTESQAAAVRWTTAFPLVGLIPSGATSFQVRLTVQLDNTTVPVSEVFRIRDITLSPGTDSDLDGIKDAWEAVHGTNPASAASRFSILNITSSQVPVPATDIQVSSEFGRRYQPLRTSDLGLWQRDGAALSGTGSPLSHAPQQADPRTLYRFLVTLPQTIQP